MRDRGSAIDNDNGGARVQTGPTKSRFAKRPAERATWGSNRDGRRRRHVRNARSPTLGERHERLVSEPASDEPPEVLELSTIGAPDAIAAALEIPSGTEVTWIERLRYAGGEPLALMHNAIPVDVIRLTADDLAEHGLYELLRRSGHIPRIATQTIGARSATAAEARILGEKRGASLLTMARTAWDTAGRALEYGSHLYRASRYTFELNLSAG